jgi:hypothetical protein
MFRPPVTLIPLTELSKLVQNAMLLYLTYHIMNRVAVFTQPSSLKIREALDLHGLGEIATEAPLSSSVLNLQIKSGLVRRARDLASETLEGLEKSVRSRTKDSWPTSVGTILLLCLCIEEIQAATNIAAAMEAWNAWRSGKEHSNGLPAVAPCRTLELSPLKLIIDIFHGVYRTARHIGGGPKDDGFNPLRQFLDGKGSDLSVDDPTRDMVCSLGRMITDSCKYSVPSSPP